jgi:large subunit ribosomal protein L15
VKLHDLRPAPGSRPSGRRLGRGHGSGRGKTAGRGTKGQKSRAGGNIPAWFEGGQTPIHIRTPKLHGFRNRGRVEYAPINLAKLAGVASGTLVTPDVLAHDGLLRDTSRPVKVLGNGDAPKGVTIHAHAFSRVAADKLAAAGSTVQVLSWPDNAPVEDAADDGGAEDAAGDGGRSGEESEPAEEGADAQGDGLAGEPLDAAGEAESEPTA